MPREVLIVDKRGIIFEGNERLSLSDGRVLRRGALGKTALSVVPGMSRLFPTALLNIQECKWISRGKFIGGKGKESGWAIHEVVHWPR